MLLPDPDRLTGLITAGKGWQVLRTADSICDKTCLEALGKLSKSRLFLPSGRQCGAPGRLLTSPAFLFPWPSPAALYGGVRCCFSHLHRAPLLPPPRRCMCAGRRRLHAPGSAASNRYRSRAPKKGCPAVTVPVHPLPTIPRYRVGDEAPSLELDSLRSGRRP